MNMTVMLARECAGVIATPARAGCSSLTPPIRLSKVEAALHVPVRDVTRLKASTGPNLALKKLLVGLLHSLPSRKMMRAP